MKISIYDPPSGWMYGFPKPYFPLAGETLTETLLRDGYPKKEIEKFRPGEITARFWEQDED